ncbi:SHOCT domain-containing protein [Halorussus salinisoli]|uniref:SHOCT domain-containing protein n=1 Tax=Halorussus salinisoli TaxID=2558242 RepID=UPI002A90A489|nr:SHOCT domain-containing protein [Halorussus salinisoli]
MVRPRNTTRSSDVLGVLTPDSRRWRRVMASVSMVTTLILFYQTVSLISSPWSGNLPSLLVGVGVVLTLLSAAAVPTILLAPDRSVTDQQDAEEEDDGIETLKRRYAAGEISEEEFEHRLENLVALSAGTDDATEGEMRAGRVSERERR